MTKLNGHLLKRTKFFLKTFWQIRKDVFGFSLMNYFICCFSLKFNQEYFGSFLVLILYAHMLYQTEVHGENVFNVRAGVRIPGWFNYFFIDCVSNYRSDVCSLLSP